MEIELISAFEVTLAEPRADEAHPAFSNLFVQARWQPRTQALLFARTPRLATERGLHMAHFLAETAGRRCWPAGADRPAALAGAQPGRRQPLAALAPTGCTVCDGAAQPLDTGLDPVCALSVRLRIGPGAKARLTFATAAARQRRHPACRGRQVPAGQPCAARLADVGHAAGIRLRALRTSPRLSPPSRR
jgi:cyclic beta-1,2-glucan synthetase